VSWSARDRRELEVLHRVALALAHSLAFSDVMDALARELTHAVARACECTISIWRPELDVLEVASVYLLDGGTSADDRGTLYQLTDFPQSRALLEAGCGHLEQRATDPNVAPEIRRLLEEWKWRTWIELPLVVDDRSLGLIEVVDYRSARRWSRRDIAFCETIASQAAMAVRNAQLYEGLRSRVERDPLTGLLNHRAFYQRLEVELARANRSGRPPVVMLLDLDDFKAINDTRGHLAGDAALRRTGEALRAVCRTGDVAARLGGDEFGLILTDADDPAAAAERVLAAVRLRAGLAASLGVATAAGAAAEAAVHRADGSLMEAKRSGKRTFRLAV
jgi:diguanylate cyclase (GGDEF)-like protein